MTSRTAQLIGYTFGCEIEVHWNNASVFSGTVATLGSRDEPVMLAQWQTDTDVAGHIPLLIRSLQGDLHFVNVYTNMVRPKLQQNISPDAVWSTHTPTLDELFNDLAVMADEVLQEKYGNDRQTLSKNIDTVETVPAESHFVQPVGYIDPLITDGKRSVMLNGELQERHDLDRYPGPWHWLIQQGETLTCEFRVDPL